MTTIRNGAAAIPTMVLVRRRLGWARRVSASALCSFWPEVGRDFFEVPYTRAFCRTTVGSTVPDPGVVRRCESRPGHGEAGSCL
jgi:hypothetical protein